MHRSKIIFLIFLTLVSCHSKPKSNKKNACDIFNEKFEWYRYHHQSQKKHGIPIWLQMSVIYSESKFDSLAKPIKKKGIFWNTTWSSASGYAQALDNTWLEYSKKHPSWIRARHNYKDSADFVGWYLNQCHIRAGINKADAYNMYLCYHEGIAGYKKGSYKNKKSIMEFAKESEQIAKKYYSQLKNCETYLKISHAYFL